MVQREMLNKGNLHSQALDLLRFPLAVIIVLVHVLLVDKFVLFKGEFDVSSSWVFIVLNKFVSAFLQGQSVPIYYFISGYVFFAGIELTKDTYARKIKNRIKTLFIPYIAWNLIYIALYYLKTLPFIGSYSMENAIVFGWRDFFMSFWAYGQNATLNLSDNIYPINYPLWFLRDLMIVVIFTPLINWFIKRAKIYYIIPIGGIWLVANTIFQGRITQLSNAFFFFSLGAYMSINKKDVENEFGKYFKPSMVLFLLSGLGFLLFVDKFPYIAQIIKAIRILMGLVFAYNLSFFLLKNGLCKVNKFLASSSFFIYLSHAWLFERVRRVLFSIIDTSSSLQVFATYLSTVTFTVLILILIYYCGKKYTPKCFNLIIGGR